MFVINKTTDQCASGRCLLAARKPLDASLQQSFNTRRHWSFVAGAESATIRSFLITTQQGLPASGRGGKEGQIDKVASAGGCPIPIFSTLE